MSKKIYLIRHAMPDFPMNDHYCIGSADFPLGLVGKVQSLLLAEALRDKVEKVYSSKMKRSIETASNLDAIVQIIPGIEEMYAGDWDGLPFSEIKVRWPEAYAARDGKQGMCDIPNAESDEHGLERFKKGLTEIIEDMDENFFETAAVVSHSTVIQLFLCELLGRPLQESNKYKIRYAAWVELEVDDDGNISIAEPENIGCFGTPELSKELCLEIMERAEVEERIILHCVEVAREAEAIAEKYNLENPDKKINMELLIAAAMLHDIARIEKNHSLVGKKYLEAFGYPEVGELIGKHHDCDWDGGDIRESEILYLADKRIKEDVKVSVESRFESSLAKCKTPEAIEAHERRRVLAMQLDKML